MSTKRKPTGFDAVDPHELAAVALDGDVIELGTVERSGAFLVGTDAAGHRVASVASHVTGWRTRTI